MVNSNSVQSFLKRLTLTACVGALCATPAFAQSEEANVQTYEALLQKMADLQLTIDRQSVYVATQESKINGLQAQVAQVAQTKTAILPMLDKMTVAIEEQIKTDVPFKLGERYARLEALKEIVADPAALPVEKMRKALSIYEIEVNYGQSLEAYDADAPANPGLRREACAENLASANCALSESMAKRVNEEGATYATLKSEIFDGTYLRYGRMSLAYVSADGAQALRYNNDTSEWDALPGSRALEVRRGIRIARGESAPGVVSAPVVVAN